MPPRSNLRWSERAGRYRNARGQFVTAAAVRADLDRALDESARTVARLAEDLRTRRIGLIDWELAMRAEIRTVQLYSAATASGGVAQLSPAALGRVGAAVREQFRYLDTFARQIEAGAPLDGRFTARARMYAQAGRSVYHRTERAEKERRGFRFEANILAPADHCATCVSETQRGRVPIGQLIPVGQRDCRVNCRCRVAYYRGEDARTAA